MPQLPDARATQHLGAGLTMVVVVGLFSYGGHLLDVRTGLSPLFLLLGLLCGSVGGFIHLVAQVAPEMLPFGRKAAERRKAAAEKAAAEKDAAEKDAAAKDAAEKDAPQDAEAEEADRNRPDDAGDAGGEAPGP